MGQPRRGGRIRELQVDYAEVIVASLAAGFQLGLVFLGLVLIVLSLAGTYKTRNESREFQADVRTDAGQIIGLGGLLIAVGVVWAAVAADLPTTTKWLTQRQYSSSLAGLSQREAHVQVLSEW
jgi:hypothetical protein